MIFLVSPDSRGRLDLSQVTAQDESYRVEVGENGVITLTPSALMSRDELDSLPEMRPVLSPDEVFGFLGSVEAADAVETNRRSRRAGGRNPRMWSLLDIHDLVWGDAA
jgi:hypothetical protein